MNMALTEWNLEDAQEAWLEEGMEKAWELAEAKYQPIVAEKEQAIVEKDHIIEELRRKLRETGHNS
jgi:hypothetical protein